MKGWLLFHKQQSVFYNMYIFPHGPTGSPTGMYASFSKGHGHQGIFFFERGTNSTGAIPGRQGNDQGQHKAKFAFVASMKYQAWSYYYQTNQIKAWSYASIQKCYN